MESQFRSRYFGCRYSEPQPISVLNDAKVSSDEDNLAKQNCFFFCKEV